VSFSSFNGILSEMDKQYQALKLRINKITKQKSNNTTHIHLALAFQHQDFLQAKLQLPSGDQGQGRVGFLSSSCCSAGSKVVEKVL